MTTMHGGTERADIEALLPWHAAGTLSRRDAERVEAALASDRELARHYDVVREELNETIHLNESLGAPSARAMERLFAAIEADGTRAPSRRSFDFAGRFAEFLANFSPRTLAWSASAAAVAIVLQAAVLATIVINDHAGPGLELASAETGDVPLASIRFTQHATAQEISIFLDAHKATVIGGPKSFRYTIRFNELPKAELTSTIKRMQADTKIVEFIAAKP